MGFTQKALDHLAAIHWKDFFHNIVIPFAVSMALTIGKSIADDDAISWDKTNDISLDMVVVGVGALCGFYLKPSNADSVQKMFDAGVGNVMFAAILLYIRRQHRSATKPFGWIKGSLQVIFLGSVSLIWSVNAF